MMKYRAALVVAAQVPVASKAQGVVEKTRRRHDLAPFVSLPQDKGWSPWRRPYNLCSSAPPTHSPDAPDLFPRQPIRQWVLSFPFQLRFPFASCRDLMGKVLGIVYRTLGTRDLEHRIRCGPKSGEPAPAEGNIPETK
jgi:hypothetical protein